MSPSLVLITATSFAFTFLFSCLESDLFSGVSGFACLLGSAARAVFRANARLTAQRDVNNFIILEFFHETVAKSRREFGSEISRLRTWHRCRGCQISAVSTRRTMAKR